MTKYGCLSLRTFSPVHSKAATFDAMVAAGVSVVITEPKRGWSHDGTSVSHTHSSQLPMTMRNISQSPR